jgi:hypothetical protein
MAVTREHFTFRVDTWTPDGESIIEHVAGRRRLRACARHIPRRLPTLARYPHHPVGRVRE